MNYYARLLARSLFAGLILSMALMLMGAPDWVIVFCCAGMGLTLEV